MSNVHQMNNSCLIYRGTATSRSLGTGAYTATSRLLAPGLFVKRAVAVAVFFFFRS